MEAAHRWGFDPNQPGAKRLLKARVHVDEVKITGLAPFVGPKGRLLTPGERVMLPKSYADGLVERGFARPS